MAVSVRFCCDRQYQYGSCAASSPPARSEQEARQLAERYGWRLGKPGENGQDRCPGCSAEQRPQRPSTPATPRQIR